MNIIQSNTYKTDLTALILPISQANLPVRGQQSYTFHLQLIQHIQVAIRNTILYGRTVFHEKGLWYEEIKHKLARKKPIKTPILEAGLALETM